MKQNRVPAFRVVSSCGDNKKQEQKTVTGNRGSHASGLFVERHPLKAHCHPEKWVQLLSPVLQMRRWRSEKSTGCMLRKKQDQDSNQDSQTLQPSVTHQAILLLETARKHINIMVPLLICSMKKNSMRRRVGLKNEFWPLMPPRSSQSLFYMKSLSSLKMISHVPLTLLSSSLKHPFVVFCLLEACSDHTADSLSALQMASLQCARSQVGWPGVLRQTSSHGNQALHVSEFSRSLYRQ